MRTYMEREREREREREGEGEGAEERDEGKISTYRLCAWWSDGANKNGVGRVNAFLRGTRQPGDRNGKIARGKRGPRGGRESRSCWSARRVYIWSDT